VMPTIAFSSSQCGAATIVTLLTLGVAPVAILLLAVLSPGIFLGLCLVSLAHANLFWGGYWARVAESSVFAAWRSYFSFSMHSDMAFAPGSPVLFAMFPHGLIPLAAFMMSDQFGPLGPVCNIPRQNVVPRVATVLFWIPFLCNLLVWLNCRPLSDLGNPWPRPTGIPPSGGRGLVARADILFADGISGMFQSSRAEERVIVKRRKNMVKRAISTGSLLVPVYCFGHTQLYNVWPGPGSWAERLSRWAKVSFILGWGATWFPWVPRRERLYVAIGKGIQCQAVDQVDSVHTEFVAALVDLFNQHKSRVDGAQVDSNGNLMDGDWCSKELILL